MPMLLPGASATANIYNNRGSGENNEAAAMTAAAGREEEEESLCAVKRQK